MQTDGLRRDEECLKVFLFHLLIPVREFFFRLWLCGAVFVTRPKQHGEFVGRLEYWVFAKKDRGSLLLLVVPLTLRFKEEIPASGKELLLGIAVFKRLRAIGLLFLLSVFDLGVLFFEGFSSHTNANFLYSLGDEALDVEAVEDEHGIGERLFHHRLHRL